MPLKSHSWCLNNVGVRGTNPPCIRKSCVTYHSALCVHGCPFLDSTNHGSCSRCICTAEESSTSCEPTVQTCIVQGSTMACHSVSWGRETHHTRGHTGRTGLVGGRNRGKLGQKTSVISGRRMGKARQAGLELDTWIILESSGLSGWSYCLALRWLQRKCCLYKYDRGGRWGCGLRIRLICIKVVL